VQNTLCVAVVLLSAVGTNWLAAQQPHSAPCVTDNRPVFDVVSIKPLDQPAIGWMRRTQDGLTVTAPLRNLIQYAFGLHDFQISGGPSWIQTKTWEVHAKLDTPDTDSAQVSSSERQSQYDRNMQQLQSVLVERFGLRCHFTSKEMPVYDLVVAKGGAKLKDTQADPTKRGNVYPEINGLRSHASGMAVGTDRLAILLSGPTGRFVVDKTGLTGSYDFTLDWVNDAAPGAEPPSDPPSGPTIYTAVEEQLGLKLIPDKGQVPVLVIDAAELPSAN
jgi:uncharacterized protein (TIGR03435 family)